MLKSTFSELQLCCYLQSFSCCCVRNLRNPAKFSENSNLYSSRSTKVIDGVNRKRIYMQLPISHYSNCRRISYSFRDIDALASK